MDKRGRSALHYAAMNDSAQLIETIFLHAKANPVAVSSTSDFVELAEISADNEGALGNIDEKYHDMEV